jgi:peptidoglycan/LPS O-acetylase OafA/YrhL
VSYPVSTLAAVAVSLVIAHVVRESHSPLTRLLTVAPLVAIGRISYGVYLWHFPVFYLFGLVTLPGTAATASWQSAVAAWAISFGAAGMSYVIVERPALALKRTLHPLGHVPLSPHGSVPPMRSPVAAVPGYLDERGTTGDGGPSSPERSTG